MESLRIDERSRSEKRGASLALIGLNLQAQARADRRRYRSLPSLARSVLRKNMRDIPVFPSL
jgi:hypothetical protein